MNQNPEPINTENKEQEEHVVKSNSEKAKEKKSFADKIMEKNSKKDSNKKENKPLKIDQEEFPDLGNMDQPKKKDKDKEKKEKEKKDAFEKKDDSDKGFETGKPIFKNSKPKNNSLMADNKTTEVSSYNKTTKEEKKDLAFENAPIKFKKSDKAQNAPFAPIVKTELERKQEEAERRAEENRKEKQVEKKDSNEKPEEKRFFKNKKFNSKDENGKEKKFTKDEN